MRFIQQEKCKFLPSTGTEKTQRQNQDIPDQLKRGKKSHHNIIQSIANHPERQSQSHLNHPQRQTQYIAHIFADFQELPTAAVQGTYNIG